MEWEDGPTEVDAPQPERIQEDRVNKKALAEINPHGPLLKVFMKDPEKKAHREASELSIVPVDAAAICSNVIRAHKKSGVFFIDGRGDLSGHKMVFSWMKQCADEKNVAQVPDLQAWIDEKTSIKPIINGMLVADKLGIPYASFNKFVARKLQDLAKDHLVDLDTVSQAYDSFETPISKLNLREFCVKSIFEAWYSYKLDGEEYWDYMCDLADMRDNIPDLDFDLHEKVKEKDKALKEARERRKNKAVEAATAGGFDASGDFSAGGGGTNGWENNNIDVVSGGDSWAMQENTNGVNGVENWAQDDGLGQSTGNWADDVEAAQSDPMLTHIAASVSGW